MTRIIHAIGMLLLAAAVAHAQVVISQVNGFGGLTGDSYDRDFVELFNRGVSSIDLNGYSLLMFADTGTAGTPATPTWTTLPLSGTIQPGQYMLVVPVTTRGGLGSSFSLPPLPPADVLATTSTERNLNSSANAVSLMSSVPTLNNGDCPVGSPDLVDFVRYGLANALCVEGAVAVGPTSGPRAVLRDGDGCIDSDNNPADLLVGQAPNPRNSAINAFVSSTVTPAVATNGSDTLVLLEVRRGNSPCNPMPAGNLSGATADLSAFGLSASHVLFDDQTNGDLTAGDGVFSYQFMVSGSQSPARFAIPISATGNGGAPTLPSTAVIQVFPTPATNDLCSNAIALSGSGVLFSGLINTAQATPDEDAGTCNGDTETKYSVWFSYTPPITGAIRIEEVSSEDIVSSVHPGCGQASTQCLRPDFGSYMPVAGGVPVLIQVGQETGAFVAPQVPLNLTITFEEAPPNDLPCGAVIIPVDSPLIAMPNAAATEAIEPGVNVSCDQGTNPPEARRGVWYTITTGSTSGALEFRERSINFSVMTVLTAADCNGPFAEIPNGCVGESDSNPRVALSANSTYFVLVSLSTFSVVPSVPYDFTLTFHAAPHDVPCSADPIATLPATRSINAAGYSSDPAHSGDYCTSTVTRNFGVWFAYASGPAETGALRVVDSSANNMAYSSYTGVDCSSLVPHNCGGISSADDLYITLQPSTQYWILASIDSSTTVLNGNYELTFEHVAIPANDLPCNATEVSASFNDFVAGPAATEDVDLSCNYNIPIQTTTGFAVWYHFLLSAPKQLTVHQNASDVLVYGLFTGPDCNNLTEIDCKMGNNGALTTDNTAYFNLQANVEYWLLIGKISNGRPFAFYDLDFTLDDANGACCNAGACTITTQAACSGNWNGPFTYCGETPQYEEFPAAPIPDHVGGNPGTPGVLTRTLNVPDSGPVTDVKVLIDLNHARTGDLIVNIMAPNGANADLMRRIDDDDDLTCPNNGSQGRLTDLGGAYIFDDQSYNPFGPGMHAAAKYFDFTGLVVVPVTPPTSTTPSGRYKASRCNELVADFGPVFAGVEMNGTWTLTISDHQSSSTGTLNRWGLIINYGSTNPCACPVLGDINGDGAGNGLDVSPFVNCLLSGTGGNCPCADLSGNGSVGVEDTPLFVTALVGP